MCIDEEKTYFEVNSKGETGVDFYEPDDNFDLELEEGEGEII